MVALIAKIESNCFYIIFSILFVWHSSDMFNGSLYIIRYVSLHNQTPLHITLSKLVFTSHCICFYYIMICPVSSVYIFVWIIPMQRLLTLNRSWFLLFRLLCYLLSRQWFIPGQQHMCYWYYLVCLIPAYWLLLWTGHCSGYLFPGYLFPGYLFPALLANQILICFMSAEHVSPLLSPLHWRCVGWLWTGHCSAFIISGIVC